MACNPKPYRRWWRKVKRLEPGILSGAAFFRLRPRFIRQMRYV